MNSGNSLYSYFCIMQNLAVVGGTNNHNLNHRYKVRFIYIDSLNTICMCNVLCTLYL